MAESLPEKNVGNVLTNITTETSLNLECAVCLQNCVHPAELPCGHVFCYLCIKGIVNRGRRCAMCRQDIPADYLDKPRLLRPVENEAENKAFEDGHSWFYEGHNGWWQYDERTSMELETAYQNGERCCELLVAGFLYVADFDSMLQYRRNDACKRRRIKRDLATTNKKGVAGLKLTKDAASSNSSNIVSNVLIPGIQNLHISSRPPDLVNQRREILRNRSLNRRVPDRRDGIRPRRHSLAPVYSNLNESTQTNVSESETGSEENLYIRNLDLDDMIHNTLDWTIQQIESLQFDLTTDYDNFSQDIDQYEILQNVVGRRNSERGQLRRSRAPVSRLNRSLENELDAPDRITRRSRLNRSLENELDAADRITRRSRLNRSLENELDAADRIARRSRLNRSEENVSSLDGNRLRLSENSSPRPDFRH